MKKKLKMRNSMFRIIMIPILIIVLLFASIGAIVLQKFEQTIGSYLGIGENGIAQIEEKADWNTEYNLQMYNSAEESREAAALVVEQIADEGTVLLKNNGVLPLEKGADVTPFGYRYLSPVYGGTGSGNVDVSADYVWTAQKALNEYFTVNTAMEEALAKATPISLQADSASPAIFDEEQNGYQGANTAIFEYDTSIYSDELLRSADGTTGIIYIGRIGGEGNDLQATAYYDGTPHALALSSYEKEMIALAKKSCEQIVVVVNSSNVMELGELMEGAYEADAIVWIGGPGSMGFKSLSKVLCGEINPSGRTVDIYPTDLTKDPTYANFGSFVYSNTDGMYSMVGMGSGFVEYEEGVYYGYRYYETAHDIEASNFSYEDAVVYPFGHGLSYTEFTKEIVDFQNDGVTITMKVNVTNIGDVAGKEVVQVYYTAPYTDFDIQYKIEKPTVVLAGFEKTEMLEPGESETVTIFFLCEEMASYCYTRDNGDGTTGCYILEEGEYVISLRNNSHDVVDTRSVTVDETIYYDNSNPRQSEIDAQSEWDDEGNPTGEKSDGSEFIAATNQLEFATAYMNGEFAEESGAGDVVLLTRSDWDNTQPTTPTSLEAPQQVLDAISAIYNYDPETDALTGNVESSVHYRTDAPAENEDNGLVLSDMRGLDYDDPLWDDYLDQIDYSDDQLLESIGIQAYQTPKYEALGIPATVNLDGPQGISKQMQVNNEDWCAYMTEPVLASTWNLELAYAMGEAVGQEALTTGVAIWYAPAVNIHKSVFGGRAFEYYSEDPLLSGLFGAQVISGCGDQGLVNDLKHYVLNDVETSRVYGHSWADEQTTREIYMKPFEICVKTAKKTVNYICDDQGTMSSKVMRATNQIMTASNAVNGSWCSQNYEINVEILRNEWGFEGMCSTDMAVLYPSGSANLDKLFRNGTDTIMNMAQLYSFEDPDSNITKWVLRRSVKNFAYTLANSNAMQGLAPGEAKSYSAPGWKIGLMVLDIALFAIAAAIIAWMILRTVDEKKNPDNYKKKKAKIKKSA